MIRTIKIQTPDNVYQLSTDVSHRKTLYRLAGLASKLQNNGVSDWSAQILRNNEVVAEYDAESLYECIMAENVG